MHVWFSLFVLLRRICLVWTNATRRSVLHISPSSIYPLVVLMERLPAETVPRSMGSVYSEGLLNSLFSFLPVKWNVTRSVFPNRRSTCVLNIVICSIENICILRYNCAVKREIWRETRNRFLSFCRISKKLLKTVLTNIGETGKKVWWACSITWAAVTHWRRPICVESQTFLRKCSWTPTPKCSVCSWTRWTN